MIPAKSWVPKRKVSSHKYHYGHVLVVGGARGTMGAPRLAALGALRGGAGLVTLAVPDSLEPLVASGGPWEALTLPLSGRPTVALQQVVDYGRERRVSCVVLGPGLLVSKETARFVKDFLANMEGPTVLDATGLMGLADVKKPVKTPLILTPHTGEMSCLLGMSTKAVDGDRRGAVREAALRFGAVVVLKGHKSLVSDGKRIYVNSTGNPGMASGGMGDVLAGVIASLVGQVTGETLVERLWRSAVLGTYWHGLAGDLALRSVGGSSVMATDLAGFLPRALGLKNKGFRLSLE